ncbi:MAG: hypothetical protein J7578_16315 [Chitinophagaceae bacterium]|nr:hypothetical protein [Chitinophagaceae bacterium]
MLAGKVSGRMIVYLQCYAGKYEEAHILEDNSRKQWILKEYQQIDRKISSLEKVKKEESGNIYQYLIEPVGHEEIPEIGTKLKIHRK